MSTCNSPATKTDRRKSKRKSCLDVIASAKIVRDPDTTDPLKDVPDQDYDNNQAYAEVISTIKLLEKEHNIWSETSQLCSDVIIFGSNDATHIPDDKKVLFAKQESLCKEISDHLSKVQRQRQIRQFRKSYEATKKSVASKYEEANKTFESLQFQILSN